jgi:Ca2+-binding RTX toxin-like protein
LAKLKFSQVYQNWTTGLLGRFERDDAVLQDSKNIKFQFPNDYDDPPDIQGWTVTYKAAKGANFKYSVGENSFNEAVSGKVGSVEVHDDVGNLVMTISGIKHVDIADIYPYIVSINDGDGPGPDQQTVMEYLVQGNDDFIGTKGDDGFGIHDDFGNDSYQGKAGSDYFEVGAGNDTIDGGKDFDHLSYKNTLWSQTARHGVEINIDTGKTIDAYGDTDTFKNIENFSGSRFADTFIGAIGDPGDYYGLQGGRGADTFKMVVATNTWVIYDDDRWDGGKRGIVADLGSVKNGKGDIKGTIVDGFGQTDKTINVREVGGTVFNDSFKGSKLDDHFNPGGGGVDSFDGGKGKDWIHFDTVDRFGDNSPHGINVNLSLGSGQIIDDGFGNTETTASIEAIVGTTFDDTIVGDAGANLFLADQGNDTLTGGAGKDKFIFGNFHGDGFKDVITDFASGADQILIDKAYIDGVPDKVRFHNGTGPDTTHKAQFFFNAGDETLYFDKDGAGGDDSQAVAWLQGVTSLTKADIQIVENYIDIV